MHLQYIYYICNIIYIGIPFSEVIEQEPPKAEHHEDDGHTEGARRRSRSGLDGNKE